MTDGAFRVDGIDRVELSVPDRYEAAAWFDDALGLGIVDEFEHWAERSAYPLLMSSDGGDTMLALFGGEQSTESGGGFRRVAFRTTGEGFLEFVDGLDSIPETDASGAADVTDFGSAHSVFFTDPYGHPFEVTTSECDVVREELGRR